MYLGLVYSIVVTSSVLFPLRAEEQVYQKGAAYDCTGVEVEEVDPTTLTVEERIALLDFSLLDSIDRYSKCITKNQVEMSQTGNGSEGGRGTESGKEGNGAEQRSGSTTGTAEANASQGNDADEPLNSKNMPVSPQTPASNNGGKKSELTPPKDNDSIVCALIWEEISSSTDESEKQGLIQQYNELKCSD